MPAVDDLEVHHCRRGEGGKKNKGGVLEHWELILLTALKGLGRYLPSLLMLVIDSLQRSSHTVGSF